MITGFESGRLSEADLETESLLDISRYTAPEAVMGGVTSASDWWGLGMMLLGILTQNRCFGNANDQLFLIHVQASGVTIPDGTGDPDGLRIVEKSNWPGVGVVFNRTNYKEVVGRSEFDKTGVSCVQNGWRFSCQPFSDFLPLPAFRAVNGQQAAQ